MKIALVTSDLTPSGGGIKEVVEGLSAALLVNGVDVRVFGVETLQWGDWGQEAWRGAPAEALPTVGPGTLAYAPDLLKRLLNWEPDIVHLHGIWQYPSAAVSRWHRITGKPYVVSPHGLFNPWALSQSRTKKAIARVLYVNRLLAEAAAFFVSTVVERELVLDLRLPGQAIVIANGITPSSSPSVLANDRGKDDGSDNILFYLGRLHPTKNLSGLLHAWNKVIQNKGDGQNWRLVIAGWGREHDEQDIFRLANELNCGPKIEFWGPLYGDDKLRAFAKVDAFILPSINEAFPVTLLEAWSVGLPVLMTDHCNLPVAFERGASFRIGTDVDTLANDISAFIALPKLSRDVIGAAGCKMVHDLFTWSHVATQAKDYYSSIMLTGAHPNHSNLAPK